MGRAAALQHRQVLLPCRRVIHRPHKCGMVCSLHLCYTDGAMNGEDEMNTRRVLLVEDEPEAARMAMSLLRDEPYRLLWATSGTDALRLARLHSPDAIVLSWTLPEMNGDQFAALLALNPAAADIPLVLFSLEPWTFHPLTRGKAVQVVNKASMGRELAPRLRDALGIEPTPLSSPEELARIRDRSLWWLGEEEEDWRPAKRRLLHPASPSRR